MKNPKTSNLSVPPTFKDSKHLQQTQNPYTPSSKFTNTGPVTAELSSGVESDQSGLNLTEFGEELPQFLGIGIERCRVRGALFEENLYSAIQPWRSYQPRTKILQIS